MHELGIVNCSLSPRQPRTKPAWNLSPDELSRRIGSGEAPHAVSWRSLTPEQKGFQAQKMEVHAAMIHRMDREIGRVLGQLSTMGELENTVVMFVSDNGASAEQIIRGDGHDKSATIGSEESYLCLGPGWSTAANTPFRYRKSWVHEGGVASPLIVHWPAGLTAVGELRTAPTHFVDLLPTMLDLAHGSPEPDWKRAGTPPLAGVSFAPALDRDREVSREYIFFSHIGHRALRIGKWKLVAVKYGKWELYDLKADRSELRNLAGQHPDKVREMASRWQAYANEFREQSGEDRVK